MFPSTLYIENLNGQNGFAVLGSVSYQRLGTAINGNIDINNDGFDDIFVAAPYTDISEQLQQAGVIYAIYGTNQPINASIHVQDIDGVNGFTIPGIYPFGSLGSNIQYGNGGNREPSTITNLGDINQDNIDDVAFSSVLAPVGNQVAAGAIYIIFGSTTRFPEQFDLSTLNGKNGFIINGYYPQQYLGTSIQGIGDLNNDGVNDIAFTDTKYIYVFYGLKNGYQPSYNLNQLPDNIITISDNYPYFFVNNIAFLSSGDINGDKINDFAIGMPNIPKDIDDELPQIFVIFGSNSNLPSQFSLSDINGINGFCINATSGPASYDIGNGVTLNVDVNKDGFKDLIFVETAIANYQPGYIVFFGHANPYQNFYNASNLSGINSYSGYNSKSSSSTINSLVGICDINGDGIDDYAVADNYLWVNPSSAGGVYIVFGTTKEMPSPFDLSTIDGTNGFYITSQIQTEYSSLGYSLSSGDFNNDGLCDILIGMMDQNCFSESCLTGSSFIIFGNET